MRSTPIVLLLLSMCGLVAAESVAQEQATDSSSTPKGAVQIEIQSPSIDFSAVQGETSVEVEGIASAIGGVRYLDMIFVMDTSQSLRKTDPSDFSVVRGYRSGPKPLTKKRYQNWCRQFR